jgi:hypothetical protein
MTWPFEVRVKPDTTGLERGRLSGVEREGFSRAAGIRRDGSSRAAVLLAIVLAAASSACGNVVRQGRSSVFLAIDALEGARGAKPTDFGNPLISDVITLVTSPSPCSVETPCPTIFGDLGRARVHLVPKDITIAPTENNEVTLTRYHVTYRRADGRNTPGVDVPYGFDGGLTVRVSALEATTFGFEIVRNVAKEESPLAQLVRNPGIIINTIAEVTFHGTDQVGNDISATGSLTVDFGNFGDF